MLFLMAQGLKHRKTYALEGPARPWAVRGGTFWNSFEQFLMTKAPRSCDKLGQRSNHAQDLGKHIILMAKGLKHRKTRVLEGSRMEFGGEGAAGSGVWGKHPCIMET